MFSAAAGWGTPILSFSVDTVKFYAVQGSSNFLLQTVTASNLGTDTASFIATNKASWILLTPNSGTAIAGQPGVSLTVGADPTNLAPAVLFDSITFSGNFATRRLYVKLTVVPATPSTIQVLPATLSFNAVQNQLNVPAPQYLTMSNTGGGIMNWTMDTPIADWLSVTPTNGSAPPGGSLTVSITRTNLPAGSYSQTLYFRSATVTNSPQTVTVTYTVASPQTAVINLSLTTFNFTSPQGGGQTPTQILIIRNTGTGGMNWSISPTSLPDWISLYPTLGAISGSEPDTVYITALPGSKPVGTYTQMFQVSSGQATNSPQSFTVNFTVTPITQPVIVVSDTALNFTATQGGSDPPSKSLTVSNGDGGTLSWTINKKLNSTWLSVLPTTGTNTGTVSVNAVVGSLIPNTYTDTLIVSGNASNSPQRVIVRLTVVPPPQPVLQVSTNLMTFAAVQGQGDPAPQTLTIWNGGPGGTTLNWSLTSDQVWLFPANASGTNTGNVNVSISIANLNVGTHEGHFTITAPGAAGAPQTVTVALNITAAPISIFASPSTFNFSGNENAANPANQSLSLTASDQTLSWFITSAKNQTWWQPTPSFGVGNHSVAISISLTGLTQGVYADTIVLNAPLASNTPLRIPIVLNLGPALTQASLQISPASLQFNAQRNQAVPSQFINVNNGGQLPLSWTATVLHGSSWLSISPDTGTNGGSITVSVATDLSPQSYEDTVKIEAPGALNSPRYVPVGLNIATAVGDGPGNLPRSFSLSQNYPNPFNPSTKIDFELPHSGYALLEVFNVTGQRIRVLADGEVSAGRHSVVWDGRDASGRPVGSGIYFYRLKSERFTDIKRMVFLK